MLFGNFDPGIHRRVKQATVPSSEGQIGRIHVPGGSVRALKMKYLASCLILLLA